MAVARRGQPRFDTRHAWRHCVAARAAERPRSRS